MLPLTRVNHSGETLYLTHSHMAVGQNQWYHFGVGEFTTYFAAYFSGDWDVHWGLTDLDFDGC